LLLGVGDSLLGVGDSLIPFRYLITEFLALTLLPPDLPLQLALKLPGGCNPGVLDALMALHQHSGYPTRLFLAQRVQGRGQNWTVHHVLGRTWHTWSWNYVKADRRPAEVLAEHLRGLR
jgi:hypothetical protein